MLRTKDSSHPGLKLSLVLIILLCLTIPARSAPVSAGTMQWTVVDTPSSQGNVIVSPSEINTIAIGCDDRTFYAVDIPHGKVYKSADSGIRWDELTGHLASAGAAMPAWHIAIAPDNPNFLAVVTSSAGLPREVFISADGGANWQNTACPAVNNIGAIDISTNYGSYDIAVGTRTGAGTGNVYMFKATGIGAWAAQGFTGDILAVKFSPNYASDSSLVTISADAAGTYINLGIHDTVANSTNWGTWGPVEVTTAGTGTSPTAAQLLTADLELPSDFSGQASSLRRFYISTDAPTTNAGIYRFDDSVGYWLMPAAANKRISSIAYYGTYAAGKLLAGEVLSDPNSATVTTWFTDAPITCPATCWYQVKKAPTGGGNSGHANAQVAWSPDGSRAYCGTSSANLDAAGWPTGYMTTKSLDESAFSITLDNGYIWNQLSLIDTEISFLSDVVASASSDTLYLASINTNGGNNGFDSLWRSTSYPLGRTWERVLCMLTATDDAILRMSQAQADQSVFYAIRSTSDLLCSRDKGQTWQSTLPGVNITDFTVTRTNDVLHVYALENNYVRKGESTYQSWKWGRKVDTTLNSGHTITATPAGVVVVGDAAEGMVAYSVDGATQFARIQAVPVPGKIHAITDARIQNYVVIYAGSDGAGGEMYCWVVGATSGWTPMEPPGQSFYGLAQAGTLYGAWSTVTNIGVDRTLNPEAIAPPFIEWDTLTAGLSAGAVFTREPTSLKISGNVDLWAIDNRAYTATTGRLWLFSDCMSMGPQPVSPVSRELLFQSPTLISPARDEVIPVDPDTARVADVNFKWQQPAQATKYELWLATDEEFSQVVLQETVIPQSPLAPGWTLSSKTSAIEPGETYYWKVRVTRAATGEPGEGQWSEVMSFSVAPSLVQETPYSGPTLLTPAKDTTNVERSPSFSWTHLPGATEYEFTLAKDEALEQIVTSLKVPIASYDYDGELDWGTTYFWQVKATEPFISEPSPIFRFTVAAEEESETSSWTENFPLWLWIVIGLLAAASLAAFIISKTKPSIFKGSSK